LNGRSIHFIPDHYDGVIDAGDYGIIDNAFQLQGAPIAVRGGFAGGNDTFPLAAVPEPSFSSCLIIAATTLVTSRRRRAL
jgi:hypothetical protein